jgi:hypothetical protein
MKYHLLYELPEVYCLWQLCYNLLGKYQIQSRQKEQFETKLKLL